MRKSERHARILQLAREMARTRNFRDYRQIELHLRADGWSEARTVLDDAFIRRELNFACQGKSIFDA